MIDSIPDLWPAELKPSSVPPPVVILRRQAETLAEKTQGLVVGEVRSRSLKPANSTTPVFAHEFQLVVPEVDYTYGLLTVRHDVFMYPVKVLMHLPPGGEFDAANAAAFIDLLRGLLSSQEIREVIGVLMAQFAPADAAP